MKFVRFESSSADDTRAIGRQLASVLPSRAVISLVGDLGAGKTTLTKGIVEGRGAAREEDVSSPTYTLIHEYGEPPSVYHIDLYRLDHEHEAARLGLEELFEMPALVLIEWGEKFPHLLPPDRMEIRIAEAGEDRRTIDLYESVPRQPS
ncbi:MAG: tRNA (adenosine(37)-N6)-threonylcarbamoyltransferase complex ATPase subunit type 1 TsaE [Bryobacteraceae bacterium]